MTEVDPDIASILKSRITGVYSDADFNLCWILDNDRVVTFVGEDVRVFLSERTTQ